VIFNYLSLLLFSFRVFSDQSLLIKFLIAGYGRLWFETFGFFFSRIWDRHKAFLLRTALLPSALPLVSKLSSLGPFYFPPYDLFQDPNKQRPSDGLFRLLFFHSFQTPSRPQRGTPSSPFSLIPFESWRRGDLDFFPRLKVSLAGFPISVSFSKNIPISFPWHLSFAFLLHVPRLSCVSIGFRSFFLALFSSLLLFDQKNLPTFFFFFLSFHL